ncbi:microtubule binding protein [Mycena floridula]|nr:microtubule binding protein [Mycena floridula]
MSRFVRASKYRHVFGQVSKKEHGIENVKVTNSAWDTNVISASGQYISINWNASGGGAFAILPLPSPFHASPNIPYKLPDSLPLARSHTAPVLDTDWSPHNDSTVASGGEDGKLLIWKVDADAFEGWGLEGWVPKDFDPVLRIDGSPRKIGQVLWHPCAQNILASASGEHTVKLWDLANPEDPMAVLEGHADAIQCIAFNSTGSLMATTSRDRKIRMFDVRAGSAAVRTVDGHGGIKGARITFMGDTGRLATTGFSKMSDRQVAVWESGGLSNIKTISLDQSSGVVMPFWTDNNILFLAGKGDGNIRYYEYESDSLHALSEHKSSDPQRGMCFLPRRALSVSDCEIARAYKVCASSVEAIAFIVPRKADSFQSDIFPPAPALEPSLTAAQFFAGNKYQRKIVNLENGAVRLDDGTEAPISMPPVTPVSAAPTRTYSASMPVEAPAPSPIVPLTPTPPAVTQSRSMPPTTRSSADDELREENAKLNTELREARAMIRNLELQVETMKANAKRAAEALMG